MRGEFEISATPGRGTEPNPDVRRNELLDYWKQVEARGKEKQNPLVESRALLARAKSLMEPGEFAEAIPPAERALAIREATLREEDLSLLGPLIVLGYAQACEQPRPAGHDPLAPVQSAGRTCAFGSGRHGSGCPSPEHA